MIGLSKHSTVFKQTLKFLNKMFDRKIVALFLVGFAICQIIDAGSIESLCGDGKREENIPNIISPLSSDSPSSPLLNDNDIPDVESFEVAQTPVPAPAPASPKAKSPKAKSPKVKSPKGSPKKGKVKGLVAEFEAKNSPPKLAKAPSKKGGKK
ncbi:pollen-specific leucine-rich repeat extensin-like protein 1 [Contarinia nasturtii]|uniref:pollen-specific leucine-rich repeat extensin-like protein 1 n=1 Tax=Contarinia nasturtii TaxID=265458 RepID=UPI0012D455C8|nr:pollen-specific leucine-rich repeat extensin-like protein 1 [Contarinia nasturtii]